MNLTKGLGTVNLLDGFGLSIINNICNISKSTLFGSTGAGKDSEWLGGIPETILCDYRYVNRCTLV